MEIDESVSRDPFLDGFKNDFRVDDHLVEVEHLKQRESYQFKPEKVEFKETHMSWVFLARPFAYKLKKPVVTRYLDLRTTNSRHLNCVNEFNLNRRLAPDVYLGVVPLALAAKGELQLEGPGPPIDWLVKMRYLAPESMLDVLMEKQKVTGDDVDRLVSLLVEFYKKARPVDWSGRAYRDRLLDDLTICEAGSRAHLHTFPAALFERVMDGAYEFLRRNFDPIDQRISGGWVREVHGDLRPEHIFLGEVPSVIDCLEFNRDLRCLDIADELTFLALETERLGHPEIGEAIRRRCLERLGDDPPSELLFFYKRRQALIRAYLALNHAVDPKIKNGHEKWRKKAILYLNLALRPVQPEIHLRGFA